MRSGRTPTQKQALYWRIAELASQYAGTEPRNVFVTLTENEPINWSFGDGVAQYADPFQVAGPPPRPQRTCRTRQQGTAWPKSTPSVRMLRRCRL